MLGSIFGSLLGKQQSNQSASVNSSYQNRYGLTQSQLINALSSIIKNPRRGVRTNPEFTRSGNGTIFNS